MEIKDILLITLPIISSYLTYFLTSRAKRDDAIFKYKEEKYGNLILLIQGFLDSGSKNTTEMKEKFFEEQYKSWLYSSDEVILATNNMVNTLILLKDVKVDSELVGDIVIAMRKDMLGKTNLSSSDFRYTVVGNGK